MPSSDPRTRRPRRAACLVACVLAVALMPVVAGGQPVVAASTGGFTPISPTRVVDTRSGLGAVRFEPGSVQTIDLSTIAPAGATAVSLNVTATEPTAATYITVWPAGATRPGTSNLNVVAGQTRPNAVIVGLGAGRSVSLYNNSGSVHLIVDVMGWTTSGFTGMQPARVLDTRIGLGAARLGPQTTIDLPVAGRSGVPANAAAVVLNLTATEPTAASYLTAWPSGTVRPATSNLNVAAGETAANLVVVGVGAGGAVSLFNLAGGVQVIADVMGWFDSSGGFAALATPSRVLDTRSGTCGFSLGPGESRTITVAQGGSVSAAVLNVIAVSASANTYLTVWPAGSTRPTASSVNAVPGEQATSNLVTVGVGAAGQVSLFNLAGTVQVVVDLFGTFAGATPSGTAVACPGGAAPTGGGAALVREPALQRSVGFDRTAVWVCRVPTTTVDPSYLSFGPQRLQVTPEGAAAVANFSVSPYFATVSEGRYTVAFEPAGYLDLTDEEGPSDCLDRAQSSTGSPFTNVLAVDNSDYGGGFAGPGMISSSAGQVGRHLLDPPEVTRRGAWVGGASVSVYPSQLVIAHEIGHTLHWPHSNLDPNDEYDNPVDLMSGEPEGAWCQVGRVWYPCKAQQTLAFNRLAAGWIDDDETVVHRSGSTTTVLAAPQQSGVQIMMAVDPNTPDVLVTLEARPRVGYDAVLDTAGVAVHLVDMRASRCTWRIGGACVSLSRRQGQAFGRPDSTDHVVAVGAQVAVAGLTIRVDRVVGNAYQVTVSGTFDAGRATLAAASARPTMVATAVDDGGTYQIVQE